MHNFRCRKGFTLVEISIVLVILGVILTTVIKGGEVLKSSKIKSMVQTQNDLQQAVLMYREKFAYLPGDDPKAVNHVGATASMVPASSNGFIDDGERLWVLHHLMKADFITGSYDGSTAMSSNFNSDISIKNVDFFTPLPTPLPVDYDYILADGTVAKPGTVAVVYKGLPYEVAQALEFALDGYDTPSSSTAAYLTGSVRGSKNYTSSNPTIPFTYVALYPVAP